MSQRRCILREACRSQAACAVAIIVSFISINFLSWSIAVSAAEIQMLDVVEVTDTAENLVGAADSSSEGIVTRDRLLARPVYRAGELLEAAPGLIVTQHSGEGKANQFFLRGFNIDHGTDLRTTVDGMPVNQRSHSHGQGWTDLNFFIPELATGLQYKKGPYYAELGDFSAAGAVNIGYVNVLPQGLAELGIGENGYRRMLVANSPKFGAGNLLYALELFHNDGPFDRGDDFRKMNGVLRYSQGNSENGFNVSVMGYRGLWDSTDQIPERAVESGLISRFGTIDKTDGGDAYRYSISGAWQRTAASSASHINAYVIRHKLDIYSNFTYFLDDPVNGDQFGQPDRRTTTGLDAAHSWRSSWGNRPMENRIGLQLQNDNIHNALLRTRARDTLAVTRRDRIVESSVGVYAQNHMQWSDKFRTVAGLRSDFYRFDVDSDNPSNSGVEHDFMTNPKLSLIFGPWSRTEYYINFGGGFHSNDARGTTQTVDPVTGLPAEKVQALVRAKGYEVGVRSAAWPGLQTAFSIYLLDFDSELLFLGDAGTTEASRPSRRIGFEWDNVYTVASWLKVDASVAYARARFRDSDAAGDRIPGAVEGVASVGAFFDNLGPYYGSLQLRYFGPRPLIEDNSVRSGPTTLLNGRIGYRLRKDVRIELAGFNLLDHDANAIDYYYESRLPGEPSEGAADIHFHPVESRSFRIMLAMEF